ncbi:hypothetical protein L3X39_05825 [Sabulilitoribacter multivorans]|uniref:Uncharacterized protein n=1 Tax=Flaviramulus multivorans TaxID=1304750 RepID=A0ABS9II94_9FLAO|nr:hypothetical protein [Flaviramulus multivorans]MCF7560150.1 hypothetical protein [Flaviramulus multivorans]
MKQRTFYPNIWSYSPYAMNLLAQLDYEGRNIKELILKNSEIKECGVSQMDLNIKKITAIDTSGNEHKIVDLQSKTSTPIKGMRSGYFLRTKGIVNLQPNTYTTIRFYLGKNNQFTYSDGEVETSSSGDFLDFDIENGLIIKNNKGTEMKIWFELAPFEFSRYFKPVLEWFKKPKLSKPKLSNCIQ